MNVEDKTIQETTHVAQLERMKTRTSEVLKRTGVRIAVVFVKETQSKSCGCYVIQDNNQQFVELNLEKMIVDSIPYKIDPSDFLEIILLHELGHVVDEKETQSGSRSGDLRRQAWNEMTNGNTLTMYTCYKEYIRLDYQCELTAWEYCFTQLQSNKQRLVAHQLQVIGLHSYRTSYVPIYRMFRHIKRFCTYLKTNSNLLDRFSFTFEMNDTMSPFFVDLQKETVHINMVHKMNWIPKTSLIKKREYVFYDSLYDIGSALYFPLEKELQTVLNKLVLEKTKTHTLHELTEEVAKINSQFLKSYRKIFAYIESVLVKQENAYHQYKQRKWTLLLDNLKDNEHQVSRSYYIKQKKKA